VYPSWEEGVIASFKLFLPAFPLIEGGEGGGQHPVVEPNLMTAKKPGILLLFYDEAVASVKEGPLNTVVGW
jgi:hypothetical protein